MKKLTDILTDLDYSAKGDVNRTINKIEFDSRKIEKGDLFVAQKGTVHDGHKFIGQVIEQGAAVIVCEDLPDKLNNDVCYIKVTDSNLALAKIAANYFDNPSSRLKLAGVTGTNGKTSIATLLHELFQVSGYKCGLLSTVCNKIGDEVLGATHTTPDAIAINGLFRKMVDEGCQYAFMEVSSHAIHQQRIAFLDFDIAIFTNITHDHLDYHQTFDEYIRVKKMFFDNLKDNAFALVNIDDKRGQIMVQNTKAQVKTYGLKGIATYKAKIIESHFEGTLVNIDNTEVWTRLIGEFNVSNLLAVYGAGLIAGLDKEQVLKILSTLKSVEGRFDYYRSNTGITAIIDYAHTPDALKNVLKTINQIRTGDEKLITVVGAGGNRDKTKRPEMANIAAEMSDQVILTSDNPRNEDPDAIIADMMEGIKPDQQAKTICITDRAQAIKTSSVMASSGDIILIAGKGHENYQEIKGVRRFFSDKEEISRWLQHE